MPRPLQYEFDDMIHERANDYDLVIVNDFGHGNRAEYDRASLPPFEILSGQRAEQYANFGFNLVTRYPCADLVCIDTPEARLAVGSKFMDPSEMVGRAYRSGVNVTALFLTLGREWLLDLGED